MDAAINPADVVPDAANLGVRIRLASMIKSTSRAKLRLPPQEAPFERGDYNLAGALIEALGDLRYAPVADDLFKLLGSDHDADAVAALAKLAPDRLAGQMLASALDKQLDSFRREQALLTLSDLKATNRVREIIPLLDDETPVAYSQPRPGAAWRICDRAATTIAALLGWQNPALPMFIVQRDQRDELLARARAWAKENP
jgi:hypothetical protein